MDNQSFNVIAERYEVEKGLESVRSNIDKILEQRGETWADVYNRLQWDKSFASIVHNGKFIPPLWQRIALAKEMGVDSVNIWDIRDLPIIKEMLKEQANEPIAAKGGNVIR